VSGEQRRDLAELVSMRLEYAGVGWDDPALVRIRDWNRAVTARAEAEAKAARRRQLAAERAK
jgi:hypothetical protein